jgi:hypothetical protein
MGLLDARRKLEAWWRDYNQNRPHSSIGDLTPAEFANKIRTKTHTISESFMKSETVQDSGGGHSKGRQQRSPSGSASAGRPCTGWSPRAGSRP